MKNKLSFTLLLTLLLMLLNGCVKRGITIVSIPAQAHCEVNGKYVGETPITVPYVENGKFHLFLKKDGYVHLDTSFKLKRKWHHYPILDFFGEVIPYQWQDHQKLSFTLTPYEAETHESFKNKFIPPEIP